MNWKRKLFSAATAVFLVLGSSGIAVYAEPGSEVEADGQSVEATPADSDNYVINGDVSSEYSIGVDIDVWGGASATVTTQGVETEDEDAIAIDVAGNYIDGELITPSSLDLNVNGTINAYEDGLQIDSKGSDITINTKDINAGVEGVYLDYISDSNVDITVDGSINSGSYGIDLDYGNNSTVDITVNKKIEIDGDDSAVYVDAYNGSDVTINVGEGIAGGYNGLSLYGDDSQIKSTVSGDISAPNSGVYIDVDDDCNVVTKVNGSIDSGDSAIAVDTAYSTGTTVNTEVTGTIDAGNDGISVNSPNSQNTNVTTKVTGNVNSDSYGISVTAVDTDKTAITTTVDGKVTSHGDGVVTKVSGSSSVTTVVTDGIDSGWNGVDTHAVNGSDVTTTVTGGIESTVAGIYLDLADDSTATASVTGDVVTNEHAHGELEFFPEAIRIDIINNSKAKVLVDGNVENEYGLGIDIYEGEAVKASEIVTEINGDLTSKAGGVIVTLTNEDTKADVLINGALTVSALDEGDFAPFDSKNAPVVLDSSSGNSDNLEFTVWKVEPNEDGWIAADMKYSVVDDFPVIDVKQNEDFEKKIQYIIKVEQPAEGGTVKATKNDGAALNKKHSEILDEDLEWALQDERVLLEVDLDPGYKLLAAYNGDGEKMPLQMIDGKYYIDVPRGGGVYLSVELGKEAYDVVFADDDGSELQKETLEYGETPEYKGDTPTKESTAAYDYEFAGWEPEISPVTGEITYTAVYTETLRSYDITFDLNGGTYEGSDTLVMTSEYGSTITLPTPTREGYEFEYWEGSRYDAGDEYEVTGAHTFKAVWKEVKKDDDKKDDNPTDDDQKDDDPTDDDQKDDDKGAASKKTSGGPAIVIDNVVTCQMAGYPADYAWNEAAKACQPGFLDDAGVFHAADSRTKTVRRGTVPNTADKDILVYAWLMMLAVTFAAFCGVRLLHEDWEI